MAVEFWLLGGVGAGIDGRTVDLGHARQRCVLAALLIDVNRVVPVEELVDRVWADRPPQRTRTTLSSYVSRLRRVLAGAGREVAVERQLGGYRVAVEPMAVDLYRFRRLTTEARATADSERAAALFDQALGLWRGQAFGPLDTPWLSSVRDTLDSERLAAELDRNHLALAHGRHASLLGELSSRAALHPLDERLAGQLILALYRCGRQAGALQQYEQLRLRLAEELGAFPSPPLQALHRQILTADPAVARPRPAGPVPRQLPAAPRAFAGRTREVAHLDAILAAASDEHPTAVVISAVSGTAGVGKTALAAHWAHRVADRFGDGQLYVNLRGFDPGGHVIGPAEAVRGFLDSLGVPPQQIPASLHAQAALYRSTLAGRRILIVLDNARDTEQVRPLLPSAPGCLVLVTSRNQLTGLVTSDGAHPLTLDLLTAAEAGDLLANRIGPTRIGAEPDAVAEIIDRCARLPLALSIVAARAAAHPGFPLAALASELRDSGTALDALAGADPVTDVRAAFSWSYHALGDAAARLFRLLGLHPGPDIAAPAAASLAGLPHAQVRPVLAELARMHLVTEHAPGRYALHDLLRAYAIELADTHDGGFEIRQARHRILDHYLHTALAADMLLSMERIPISLAPAQPGVAPEHVTDHNQAMAWFDTEHPVLLAAIQYADDTGSATHAWQLPWTLFTFLDRRGHWHDLAAVQRVAVDAARRLADQPALAEAHRILASAYVWLSRDDEALTELRHALDLFDALGDQRGQARTQIGFAWILQRQGYYTQALGHAEQALSCTAPSATGWGRPRPSTPSDG